jgi:hypothetical protein
MEAIILIPGILGSKLRLSTEEIWPPSLGEVLGNHYTRVAKLRNPSATAAGIIDEYTVFFQIYRPIMSELDSIAGALGATRLDFYYDWRNDLWDRRVTPPSIPASELLAQAIDRSVRNGASSVILVAHSMGGLVARLVLESGKYNRTRWFSKISKFIAVCVPQVGAPLAVARALGLSGSTTISASDMKLLTGDPRFPAAYQLFPAPAYREKRSIRCKRRRFGHLQLSRSSQIWS